MDLLWLVGVFNTIVFDLFIKCVYLTGDKKIHMELYICLVMVYDCGIWNT